MYHVCEAHIHWDSGCFINVPVKKIPRDGRERTLYVFFILQKHIVLLLLRLYTNKSRTFAV